MNEQHWEGALRDATPCYRAVYCVRRDFKTVQPVLYRFQISYLTFDFPLQLGFDLHFTALVNTTHLPGGFLLLLLKAASDIKFQLSHSEVIQPPNAPSWSSGVPSHHTPRPPASHYLGLSSCRSLSASPGDVICWQLITMKSYLTVWSEHSCIQCAKLKHKWKTPEAVGNKN